MLERARMIAYDKRGSVFALTEGAELLLHDGESEGPLWRTMLDARIVAELHRHSEVVMTWPVEDLATLDRVSRIGVTGVISSNHDVLAELVARRV